MDVDTLGLHCMQSVILVGLAAPTVWSGQEIWKGGRADTEDRRHAFRLCGALFFVFSAAILSRYIAQTRSLLPVSVGLLPLGHGCGFRSQLYSGCGSGIAGKAQDELMTGSILLGDVARRTAFLLDGL